jgi:hypothetical protein
MSRSTASRILWSAMRIKLLVYDGTGLVLIWKRLEGGTFKWPPVSDGVMRLSGAQLAALFDGSVPVRRVGSIEEAVSEAARLVPSDGTVILAPACSSWDMFRDYRERGDRFGAAARALAEDERIAHA